MDTINSEATTSGEATTVSCDPREQWRMQLQPESRQRIVSKIMDTLKRHLSLPVQGQEGLIALRSSAVRFEEKTYAIATSPSTLARERPAMETGDWRTQLQSDSRQRIVNKIVDTFKKHLSFGGEEGLNQLRKIALRFEERTYTTASSQSDYLRRISLKMLTMEVKSQNTANNSGNCSNLRDPGSRGTQSQFNSEGATTVSGDLREPWQMQLQPESRQRIVSKIVDTLKTYLPFPSQEGLNELRMMAVRFEERIYAIATSRSDYLRRISFKMFLMESRSRPSPIVCIAAKRKRVMAPSPQ